MAIATTSPVTGEFLRRFDELTPEEPEHNLARAAAAAASYRLTSVEERAARGDREIRFAACAGAAWSVMTSAAAATAAATTEAKRTMPTGVD